MSVKRMPFSEIVDKPNVPTYVVPDSISLFDDVDENYQVKQKRPLQNKLKKEKTIEVIEQFALEQNRLQLQQRQIQMHQLQAQRQQPQAQRQQPQAQRQQPPPYNPPFLKLPQKHPVHIDFRREGPVREGTLATKCSLHELNEAFRQRYGKGSGPRYENSLLVTAQKFYLLKDYVIGEVLNLNDVADFLGVPKRRLYDITNVLEGISLVEKIGKNSIRWTNVSEETDQTRKLKSEIENMKKQEEELDRLLDNCRRVYTQFTEDPADRPFSYIKRADIRKMDMETKSTSVAIKTNRKTFKTIEVQVADPQESKYQMIAKNKISKPMDAFLCVQGTENYVSFEPSGISTLRDEDMNPYDEESRELVQTKPIQAAYNRPPGPQSYTYADHVKYQQQHQDEQSYQTAVSHVQHNLQLLSEGSMLQFDESQINQTQFYKQPQASQPVNQHDLFQQAQMELTEFFVTEQKCPQSVIQPMVQHQKVSCYDMSTNFGEIEVKTEEFMVPPAKKAKISPYNLVIPHSDEYLNQQLEMEAEIKMEEEKIEEKEDDDILNKSSDSSAEHLAFLNEMLPEGSDGTDFSWDSSKSFEDFIDECAITKASTSDPNPIFDSPLKALFDENGEDSIAGHRLKLTG